MTPDQNNAREYDLGDLASSLQSDDFDGLGFEFFIDPGRAPVEAIVELFTAISALHISLGGSSLLFYLQSSGLMKTVPSSMCYFVEIDTEFI